MAKRAETIFFFLAVLAALVVPALPLVQELSPIGRMAEVVAVSPAESAVLPQQVALAH
jgi:hypothetical protein